MGFQTLGNDSRYQTVVQINNTTEGNFQQEAARTYDVGISTSSNISNYSESGSYSYDPVNTDRYYLFRDTSGHFTGDIDVNCSRSTSNDGEGIELYINGNMVDMAQDDDDFSDTVHVSGTKYDVTIQTISIKDTDSYYMTGNYDFTITYDSPSSSSYNVNSVTQE